ncbi:MAG: HAMP domain-containing histidine kinase [Chloroflexia bacterium]|nr:HAMP domain-containing histidine kinase [Chloroflexia bacterium]
MSSPELDLEQEPRQARPAPLHPAESLPPLDPPVPAPPVSVPERPRTLPGGRRRDRGRPPWWPDDEPWPPPKTSDRRGGFLRKVGCFFGVIFLLMIAASILGAIFSDGGGRGGDGYGGPPWGFFFPLIVAGSLFLVWRTVRRTAAPIADVMSAADRVADGDYAVRVESRANGEVGRLVESFNAMTTRLETNETQRRNLFADVAHELRTPLSIIRGNTEGMLDGVYPRDDAHLDTILDATAMMARLLDDLRTLSLTDTGALRLHKQTTDVAELLDDIRYGFTARAEEAGVIFTLEAVPLPPLDIDPVRVRQVLENLLDNALRHTPPGGTIRVEVQREGSAALFRVADTGRGIPAEALPHVFDRFWKSADSGGSGLGLAIARGLIEAHGGKIRADSVVERGTVVSFTLPAERVGSRKLDVVRREAGGGSQV